MRHASAWRLDAFDGVLVFALALAFYWMTLAPTVVWSDSAQLAVDARYAPLQLSTAGDHPLFVLFGRLFARLPGDLARNINLEAAFFGALTVMLVYQSARRLGASPAAALAGASALCVSHTFWLHSVIAEVYTANAFFLIATIRLLIEWLHRRNPMWLAAAVAAFAIGLTNHLVLATMAPAILAFLLVAKRHELLTRRAVVGVAVALVVVAGLAVVRPAALMTRVSHFWYGPPGIQDYLALDFDAKATAQEAKFYLLYLVYQFPSAALLLGAIGLWAVLRDQPSVAVLLLVTLAVNAVTFVRHTVWPSAGNAKYVFYIADYVVFSLLVALGAKAVLERVAAQRAASTRWALGILAAVAFVPPMVYTLAPWAVRKAGVDLFHARSLPYRDNERFFLNPNKHGEDGARRFGEEALREAKADAVIFTDYTPFTVLLYLKVIDGLRPDVLIVGPKATGATVNSYWVHDAAGRRRPTYLAAYVPDYHDLSGLKGGYDLIPVGPLLEVRPR